jgi:hypothetical protein
MNIFPSSILSTSEKIKMSSMEKKGYKDILFDYKKKQIVVRDGKLLTATKTEQLQQWLYLLINTEVGKYKVYENNEFGIIFLYEMRGKEYYTSGFTIASIKDELTEKILKHHLVDEVVDIQIEKNFNTLTINIVLSVDNEIVESEVDVDV